MKKLILSLVLLSCNAHTDWSPYEKVNVLNVAGNGIHGTHIGLENHKFPMCSSDYAILEGSNVNYKELFSVLLAAKMAKKNIRINYIECAGAYAKIREVAIE